SRMGRRSLLPLLVAVAALLSVPAAAGTKSFQDCSGCPQMIVVPAGAFLMGSPQDEPDRNDAEGPQHRVVIAHAFAIGKFDVTRAQYGLFVASTGGHAVDPKCDWTNPRYRGEPFHQGPNEPVVCVNWADAKAYAAWLTARTGHAYRLPGEAEWEYAARAGSTTARPWGPTITHENANIGVDACCGPKTEGRDQWQFTSPVGSFAPNAFGLYDMIGNVWQLTGDCASDYADLSHLECDNRMVRGSGWLHGIGYARSAARAADIATRRAADIGFRVVRSLD
ncbi:MAG: formylglycine-generating enzyme family protein, partial [Stellaceae bacterium]